MTTPSYPFGWAAMSKVRGDAAAWSSASAWNVNFNNGNVNNNHRNNQGFALAVRRVGECQGATAGVPLESLYDAWRRARRQKVPSYNQLRFDARWSIGLLRLQREIESGTWAPRRSTCFIATRPKAREIHAPDFADRVVHARRRVFCASLADVFDNAVDPKWRADLFALIAATPNLDWLLLTKRIGNVAKMAPAPWIGGPVQHGPDPTSIHGGWPAHVWIGATVCNQEEVDRDVPKLLRIPAAVRFLSIEPMLGPIDLTAVKVTQSPGYFGDCLDWYHQPHCNRDEKWNGIDWVIVGGESGAHARPMHPDWVRSLRDQCAFARVKFMFKQWGEWAQGSTRGKPDAAVLSDGRVLHDWTIPAMQAAHRQKAVPPCKPEIMSRVGKKAAGRLLDDVTHDGYPEVKHG